MLSEAPFDRGAGMPFGTALSGQLIEREIEQEHVHARLAQEPEQAAFGMVRHELANTILGQIARFGDARDLK